MQNGFVESRNVESFVGLEDAMRRIEAWRHDHNQQRLHRSIGRIPPAVVARRAAALQAPTPLFTSSAIAHMNARSSGRDPQEETQCPGIISSR